MQISRVTLSVITTIWLIRTSQPLNELTPPLKVIICICLIWRSRPMAMLGPKTTKASDQSVLLPSSESLRFMLNNWPLTVGRGSNSNRRRSEAAEWRSLEGRVPPPPHHPLRRHRHRNSCCRCNIHHCLLIHEWIKATNLIRSALLVTKADWIR